MSELGRGRVVVKECRGNFIPTSPNLVKNKVGASQGAKLGPCDWGITQSFTFNRKTCFACNRNSICNLNAIILRLNAMNLQFNVMLFVYLHFFFYINGELFIFVRH
jgi:hypothetical protein